MSVNLVTDTGHRRDLSADAWQRFREMRWRSPELGLSVDISHVRMPAHYRARMHEPMASALEALSLLEQGAIANADEDRMVGHYWLRAPELAPSRAIAGGIEDAVRSVRHFAQAVHDGRVAGSAGAFRHVVHVGVGGSANGPQLICDALDVANEGLSVDFLDNNDRDGIDRLERRMARDLRRTLVSVVRTGETPTPRHLVAELRARYAGRGLDLTRHAVATTIPGTALDSLALSEGWLARFPLWDWVGGRTSVTSAVGLLPLALQGGDVAAFLNGAATMDRLTRERGVMRNPAALLALAWHWLGDGYGSRRMVILPYKDRMAILPRYLQQLVMESVGKRLDRRGAVVQQGLTVLGHKGSSDQHAYVQQLRDGTPDAFVVFVRVHAGEQDGALEIEPGTTLDDHLFASLVGTREALSERGRHSITISLADAGECSLGALIALFERAVGLYAELVDVNAYHQPGVDKHASSATVALQRRVRAQLAATPESQTAAEVAHACGESRSRRCSSCSNTSFRRAAPWSSATVTTGPGHLLPSRPVGPGPPRERCARPATRSVRERFPRKCFGYLLGASDSRVATDFVLFNENERNNSEWRGAFEAYGRYFRDHHDAGFVASPEESWRIQKRVWARGLQQVGVFHSHRRHPANFSLIDYRLHMRNCEGLWHMIVSMRNPELPQVRAFDVSDTGVRELDVQPAPSPASSSSRPAATRLRVEREDVVRRSRTRSTTRPRTALHELLGSRSCGGAASDTKSSSHPGCVGSTAHASRWGAIF